MILPAVDDRSIMWQIRDKKKRVIQPVLRRINFTIIFYDLLKM